MEDEGNGVGPASPDRDLGGPGAQGEAPVEWERRLGGWLSIAEDVLYALVGLVVQRDADMAVEDPAPLGGVKIPPATDERSDRPIRGGSRGAA